MYGKHKLKKLKKDKEIHNKGHNMKISITSSPTSTRRAGGS